MKDYLIYILLVSSIGFILALSDKNRAIKGRHRISERTLFISAVLGGGVGLLIGLLLSNHKTRRKKFMIGVPVIIVVHFVVAAFIFNMR